VTVRVDFDCEMTTRDGVTLRADVYRPDSEAPLPAILLRTPYNKAVRHVRTGGFDPISAALQGFAFVIQDVRGRWASEGEYAPVSRREGPDGFDAVEWVAAQPWCDGNVGMVGPSYESLVQIMAAAEHPPSLRAIAPEYTSAGQSGGPALLDSILIGWVAFQALDGLGKKAAAGEPVIDDIHVVMEALADPQHAALHLPLEDMPLMRLLPSMTYADMVEAVRDATDLPVDRIEIPALVVGGWYDIDPAGTARFYRELCSRGAAATAREQSCVVWGPWEHGMTDVGLGEKFFGMQASAEGRNLAALYFAFFARHLKGDSSQATPTATYFVTGHNEWREAEAWPPPTVAEYCLYLASGDDVIGTSDEGRLCPSPPEPSGSDGYVYDPMQPVPSFGGRYLKIGGSRPGPFDQQRIETRQDVLVYTSAPLTEPLEAIGNARAKLFVSSSAVDTDFVVKLCDVDLDGRSYNISDAISRLRYRHGWEPELVEPGQIYEITLDLSPIGHAFLEGHRVRLQIASSAFPAYDRNMNTGAAEGSDAAGIKANQRVWHGGEHQSRLELQVEPAGSRGVTS